MLAMWRGPDGEPENDEGRDAAVEKRGGNEMSDERKRRRCRQEHDKCAGDVSVQSVLLLAEVRRNDKYLGHFPDLWFTGVNRCELARERKSREGG